MPLKNTLWLAGKKILLLDSLGIFPSNSRPDILLLTNSPKINLDRALLQLRPEQVVADGTNHKNYVSRWKAACNRQHIPFHATSLDGFYKAD
jgi:competence protein ComEC